MLFNSFVYLLAFLPAAVLIDVALTRWVPSARLPALAIMSAAFYAYWDWRFLPLLMLSIMINWTIARIFTKRGWILVLAIGVNMVVLAFFKYWTFAARNINSVAATDLPIHDLALPLGISFFTFHHVMYLADVRSGVAPKVSLTKYALYIGFFPQVLAGPLVRWSELLHQFEAPPTDRLAKAVSGVILIVIGLVKKVWLGDNLAQLVDPVFATAGPIGFLEAWQGALAFTFQIYFDFSGYTDIALGSALLFGYVLPQNFNSPYKASSLQEFWRRWHITLSRFLRDYLYIPLGGNRHGRALQITALFTTMALGGLWHGAAWTFIAWGVMHGVGLGVGAAWRKTGRALHPALGWAITFMFALLAWVLFRATNFDSAMRIYQGLLGLSGLGSLFSAPLIATAAVVSLLMPNSTWLSDKLPRHPLVAIALATSFVAILLTIGDGAAHEFIYFQF